MYGRGETPIGGSAIADRYGLLAHYFDYAVLDLIVESGGLGNPGVWLTPTPYAACLTPYDLGLNGPRDACLLVDVRGVDRLWGPGTSPASGTHPGVWRGGGIEFFSPDPIPFDAVRRIMRVRTCGGEH